jgi:hypothetical protein
VVGNIWLALTNQDDRNRFEGDILVPRREFARDLSISERTTARMRLPTTYLGNTAFIARNAGMKIVTETLRRRWSKESAA